jgi:hypothetical protein
MVTQDQLERGTLISSTATAASTNKIVKRKRGWLDSDVPADQDRWGELK